MKRSFLLLFAISLLLYSCKPKQNEREAVLSAEGDGIELTDTIQVEEPVVVTEFTANDIRLVQDLTYDKYTLEETYPYKDTVRHFQFDKYKEVIAKLENLQREPQPWGILQNRKNKNGEAPLVPNWSRNEYKNVADTLGVERFQGIPLYLERDSVPIRYGLDGELVRLHHNNDSSEYILAETVYVPGNFKIPRKYVYFTDTIQFDKIAFVDRKNQNIAVVERADTAWLVRSMNPATTGQHRPPYAHDTPLGIFVVQEKKDKMYYLVDGTSRIAGYAPWASRFSNGGYIHGVPTNNPNAAIIEYSQTLGTIPRSHMCVRNASSHAKFFYDMVSVGDALVVVIE